MYRAERRREIKQIKWKLNFIEKHSPLKKLLNDKALNQVTEDDRLVLAKGEHEDKYLQEKFNNLMKWFKEAYTLEERLQYLQVGYRVPKEDVPAV